LPASPRETVKVSLEPQFKLITQPMKLRLQARVGGPEFAGQQSKFDGVDTD
jgi:hypothetical protein